MDQKALADTQPYHAEITNAVKNTAAILLDKKLYNVGLGLDEICHKPIDKPKNPATM